MFIGNNINGYDNLIQIPVSQKELTSTTDEGWDLFAAPSKVITINSNSVITINMIQPTNITIGYTYVLTVIKAGTGNHLLTFETGTSDIYRWSNGTAEPLTDGAESVDIYTFVGGEGVLYGAITNNFT